MSTTAVIGLGILVWAVVSVLVALFVARMIRLRDHQGQAARRMPLEDSSDDDPASARSARRGWWLRSRT